MFSVHQQTIRAYEKQGFITPKRTEGNTRLFSEEDIDRLEEIIYLTHELGINLAGIEMILKLKKQMGKLQKEMNTLFESTKKSLELDAEASQQSVQRSARKLLQLKQETPEGLDIKQIPTSSEDEHGSETSNVDEWEIEYDE